MKINPHPSIFPQIIQFWNKSPDYCILWLRERYEDNEIPTVLSLAREWHMEDDNRIYFNSDYDENYIIQLLRK